MNSILKVREFNLNLPFIENEEKFIDTIYSILTIASLCDKNVSCFSDVDNSYDSYIAFHFYDFNDTYNFNFIFKLQPNLMLGHIKIYNHLINESNNYSLNNCDIIYSDFINLMKGKVNQDIKKLKT